MAEQASPTNQDRPLPPLWVLVLLAAVSPLAMNLFVPSMPSIATDLGTSYAGVQLGLSLFLAATAVMQLASGPISDKIGRKPVLIGGLIIFLIGTVICTLASDLTWFLIGRVIQCTSAVGMVLSRAIVRDVYPREKSASMIGYVVMGMAVAPMIGPAMGGWLDGVFGWQSSFVMLGLFGVVSLIVTIVALPETNTGSGRSMAEQAAIWRSLMTNRLFWLYTLVNGLASSVFFSFLGGGPSVSSNFLQQTPFEYGAWFALCALGYAFGNFLSGRFSEQRGIERMIADGAILTLAGPAISLGLFSAGFNEPWALFVPQILVGVGNGMTLPNVNAAAISLRPDAAGAASGLLGALQIGLGALGSVLAGIAVGNAGSPIALGVIMLAFGVSGFIAAMAANRMAMRDLPVEAERDLG